MRMWDQEVKADLDGCVERVVAAIAARGWRPRSDGEVER